ncbi:MAG TPA: anti-sigma factor [Acetobacteraceae bacterium]
MTGADLLPIGEDDLHAYVDGQLAQARREAVEQHLSTDPEAARRVAAYQQQRAALRAAFAAPDEPLPARLMLASILRERRRSRLPNWRIAAGLVLGVALGGSAGWLLHVPSGRGSVAMATLEQEAFSSHTVYAADRRHPIEVGASEAAHLRQWLSNRLDRSVAPPDLSASGYHLIGGRLLATEHGNAAALFMYENAGGQRLSLLFRPMAPTMRASPKDISQGRMNGCAWIDKGMGYAVVGVMPDSELDGIADDIRVALNTG